MLNQLFAPRWLCGYSESPVADWLIRFSNWLLLSGYARRPAPSIILEPGSAPTAFY